MKRRKASQFFILVIFGLLLGCRNHTSQDRVAFTHVNVVPMTREIVLPDQTVLVEGSQIVAVGSSNEVQIPAGSLEINGEGYYLLPGLADMHMHTRADWGNREIWPVHPLYLYLANGVTTIRDFAPSGSPLDYALQWRQEIHAGDRIGPTIYATGKLLYASPLQDPESIVRQNYDLGFDFLKLYSYLSKHDFHQAMNTAKELDMYTAGHIPYAVGLEGVLTEGMDEIAHVEELLFEFIEFDRDRQLSPEGWMAYIIKSTLRQFDMTSNSLHTDFEIENHTTLEMVTEQLRTAEVPVCTTMVLDDVIQLKLFGPDAFLARPENIYFENGYLESYQRGEEKHQVQCKGVEAICAFKGDVDRWIMKGLHEGDVMLLLGTDSGTGGMGIVPGYSLHDELRILVENGFTPYEALRTGTVNAALVIKRMSGDGNFGAIEVGNRADLILVDGNPLEELGALRSPLGVMAAGRWFPAETLNLFLKTTSSDLDKE